MTYRQAVALRELRLGFLKSVLSWPTPSHMCYTIFQIKASTTDICFLELLDHCNYVVHLGQVTFLLEDKQGFKFGGVDNVNFYHYPSYISVVKSSLPKLLTYLILNFTLLL